jgi:hypothetical protein
MQPFLYSEIKQKHSASHIEVTEECLTERIEKTWKSEAFAFINVLR